ncbi:MAG: hypothetical protein ACLPJH_07835 [Myxococcaceae bacterium]
MGWATDTPWQTVGFLAVLASIYFGSGWLLAWGFPYGLSRRRLHWFNKLGAVVVGFALWFLCETLRNALLLYWAERHGIRGIAHAPALLLLVHYYLWLLLVLVVSLRLSRVPAASPA